MIFWQIGALLEKYDATLKTPVKELPDDAIEEVLYGSDDRIKIKSSLIGTSSDYFVTYEGVVKYIQMLQEKDASATAQKWAEQFAKTTVCPECKGARLNKEALHFRIHDKNINELANMDISELYDWLMKVDVYLSDKQKKISVEILKEIRTRLKFLLDVGLDYLALNRSSVSLSGGESQRIRLATQIGSQLVNVLYILDEPSIGLHQRDNLRLINSLKELRDMGNSVIVVEHDKDMMLAADYVIDMGPKAGRLGGEVVFAGTPTEMLKTNTMTSQYLNGKMKIEIPAKRRKGNGKSIWLRGAKGNNLKNVDVEFPLGKLICVTGVSGSGKSTLINETLQPILSQKFYRSLQDPLEYDSIEGTIKLYNNQVFIADNIKEVIPEYLMVLKGVIDCPDLPLNVSRSALQNDGFVNKISEYISKKVADKLSGMCKTKREDYEKYWDNISPFIKFGCLKDEKFCDKMKDAVLFKNLDHKYLTLKDCIEANGGTVEDQNAKTDDQNTENKEEDKTVIYYVTDEIQQSQYINMFKNQGMDAVILGHNIDSPFITQLEQRNQNIKFQRIDADVTAGAKEEVAEEEKEAFQKKSDSLVEIFRKELGNENLDVKIEKLKDENVASMMTLSEENRRMQEMMKMYGMNGMDMGTTSTLILNANHPLVQYVVEHKDSENTSIICKQLYDLAMLAHKPLSPEEMTAFVQRSNEIMMLLTK